MSIDSDRYEVLGRACKVCGFMPHIFPGGHYITIYKTAPPNQGVHKYLKVTNLNSMSDDEIESWVYSLIVDLVFPSSR